MALADFIFSDMWFWFWVMIPLVIIFTPFGLKGMIDTYRWADRVFLKPRKGYVLVKQKLPNDRMREFWVLPTGKLMKFRTIDNEEIEQPIKMEKGWVLFDGNLPLIHLDEHNQQIFFGKGWSTPSISQEEITRGYKAAYETGKLIGSVEMLNDLRMWLIIAVAMIFIFGGVSAYESYGAKNAALSPVGVNTTQIADAIASRLYTPLPQNVPMVK